MTYIVLYAFRDKDNFNLIHNIGEDVSYMDQSRLDELSLRGYVKIVGGVTPPEPAKPATIEGVSTYEALQVAANKQSDGAHIYFVTEDEKFSGGFPAIYICQGGNIIRLVPQQTG